MSNISKISDLKGKKFRLKEKLVKNQLMPANHSFSFSLQGLPKIATYYYGEKELSVNMISVKDTPLFYLGNFNIYSFYYNSYESDYGNKPRIITFEDFNENQVQFSGYGGYNPTETREDVFIKWWNFNTEEVSIQEVLRDLGDSIRKISGKTNKIPFIKMSYELESGMKDYVIPEGSIEITENGEHNVREFEKVNVDVPIPEGFIKPSGSLNIDTNGEHNVNEYEKVNVNVPQGVFLEGTEIITENGEYDIYDFEFVNVNVPIPEGYLKPEGKIEIIDTEEVDVTEFKKAQVVDENLKAENIAEGVEVLGITGTFRGGIDTSDATATGDDLLLGKTAYAKDEKIVGTIETYNYETVEEISPEIDKLLNGTMTEIYNDRITYLDKCFGGSRNLKKVELPNVTECYHQAFSSCLVEYISLPRLARTSTQMCNGARLLKVALIDNIIGLSGGMGFYGCSSLQAVVIRQDTTIPPMAANTFDGSGIKLGTGYVYVPRDKVEEYKLETNWSVVASQIRAVEDYTMDGTLTGKLDFVKMGVEL